MSIRPLSDTFSIGPQITVSDLPTLKAQGFNSLIICRPDGEEGQPSSADISAAAAEIGMATAYAPVVMGESPLDSLAAFEEGMQTLEGPTLGYCKSGMRAAMLWALSQRGKQSADEILGATASAGLDLERLRPALG